MFSDLAPLKYLHRFPQRHALCYCLFLLLAFSTNGNSRPTDAELSKVLSNYLSCLSLELMQPSEDLPVFAIEEFCLTRIYNTTGVRSLWVTGEGPNEKGRIIFGYLKDSYQHGLDPKEYKVDRMLQLWSTRDVKYLAELDTLITYNLVKYIHDISYGVLKPLESDPELFAEAGDKDFNPVVAIKHVLATSDLNKYLAGLPPQNQHYLALKAGLAHYRQMAEKGDWVPVPEGASLHPGDIDERIKAVRKRLQSTDPLLETPRDTVASIYDPWLQQAVLTFQRQHGLTADGVIGKNTIAALNISIAEKIASIRINMARWRWQAHDLGNKYVLVNIANFNLKAFQDGKIVLDIPVIVGEEQHQTPVFSGTIKYLDINPFWNIPTSIAQKEELPELRKNKKYLVERHVRLFSSWQDDAVELDSTVINWHTISEGQIAGYKLRQDPGPWNALGKIKFVFPNQYSVYMHDTPAHYLFGRTKRDFSHGCIRVSKALSLAIFLLKDHPENWPIEKVKEYYNQDQREVIRLSHPVPIHITYQTTWVDEDGTMHFNRDIYERDAQLYDVLLR